MIIELGHYALVLALAASIIIAILPVIGAKRGDAALMAVAVTGTMAQFLLVAFSFSALTWAYVVSDFSVQNVWENSHSMMPAIYRYSAVWGNHVV
jgi:cytochrome c-type biogenesis protein CcmF